MSRRNTNVHLSIKPDDEERLNRELTGYHACLRKVKFNPHEEADWKRGYERAQRGESLTQFEVRYMLK